MCRNYTQYFSIALQPIADPNYRFLAVDVGAYRKESDSVIFRYSNLSKIIEAGAFEYSWALNSSSN